MATEKQIAANHANAKRSTGPRTLAGKQRSAQNAYRHGLSGPLPHDPTTKGVTDKIARAVALDGDGPGVEEFLRAQLELLRIRAVRFDLQDDLASGKLGFKGLRSLAALARYERLARTKRRRAARLIA